MRYPRWTIRRLMIAILAVGLILGATITGRRWWDISTAYAKMHSKYAAQASEARDNVDFARRMAQSCRAQGSELLRASRESRPAEVNPDEWVRRIKDLTVRRETASRAGELFDSLVKEAESRVAEYAPLEEKYRYAKGHPWTTVAPDSPAEATQLAAASKAPTKKKPKARRVAAARSTATR